jgi:hypothetical protein
MSDRPKDGHDHPLITAGRVDGTPVFDKAGKKIGHVKDLSIEKKTGRVVYALLSFGGFLGIGERIHPLPWDVLDYDTGFDGYILPLTRDELEKAPSYSVDELAKFGGKDVAYRELVFGYYGPFGATPYW